MSAVFALFRLQQVDTRIDIVGTRLRAIRETLENDSQLQAAIQKHKDAEQEERRLEQKRHTEEEEARDQQIKIQQAEARLYGGAVHNPKELQDLQADVASLKKRVALIEEQELESMIQLEGTQALRQQAETGLAAIRARLGEDNRHLLDEQATLSRDLESLQAEHRAAVSSVDPQSLRIYEAVRQGHRGLAVAEVMDDSCGACGTRLTAALQQNARHAPELALCPSCGRILFAA